MWILILAFMTTSDSKTISSNSVEFSERMNCLKAMEELINWEGKKDALKIKAICVKK